MAECIEREKVLELIGSFKRDDVTEHCEDYAAGWNDALEQIECNVKEDIPAADVHPERRGEWINIIKNTGGCISYICATCSECCNRQHFNDWQLPPFCQLCGAKMDGKDGENNG